MKLERNKVEWVRMQNVEYLYLSLKSKVGHRHIAVSISNVQISFKEVFMIKDALLHLLWVKNIFLYSNVKVRFQKQLTRGVF